MIKRCLSRAGLAFVELLLVAVVICIGTLLALNQFTAQQKQLSKATGGKTIATTIDMGKAAACSTAQMSFRTNLQFALMQAGTPRGGITAQWCEQNKVPVPVCPAYGVYSIDANGETSCSVHGGLGAGLPGR